MSIKEFTHGDSVAVDSVETLLREMLDNYELGEKSLYYWVSLEKENIKKALVNLSWVGEEEQMGR